MKSVSIREAQVDFFRLIERVQAGEEIIIAKAGRPAARLVPIQAVARPVRIGGLEAPIPVPDDFNTMFERGIEALFTGVPTSARSRRRK